MAINLDMARQWVASGYPMPIITSKCELRDAKWLLDEAIVLDDDEPGTVDPEMLKRLNYTVIAADERHWTFQWVIIVGAIISVLLINWWGNSKKTDIEEQKVVVESVEKWTPGDTTLAMSIFKEHPDRISYSTRLTRPALYKAYQLQDAARKYYGVQKNIDYYSKRVTTLTEADKIEEAKKTLEKLQAEQPQKEKEAKERFEKISAMNYEEIKAMALEETGKVLEGHKGSEKSARFWFWFLIICIPLYIFACRPHGYTLNKYSTMGNALNVIQRFGLWASGALVAGSAALQFTEIITKWSDGSTTRSDDGTGPLIAALKIALLVAALAVFCFTSCIIMAIATIAGLIRNYHWSEIIADINARFRRLTHKNN